MRNYKTKELEVTTRVISYFPTVTWQHDRRIYDGCSKRRPDLMADLATHVIIIEVDENKHTSYDCSCENKRLMELSQDLYHRPIVFIRFNPDGYTNEHGVKISSCWRVNKYGIMQIMKTREEEWNARIASLLETIQYWLENQSDRLIQIIELFY